MDEDGRRTYFTGAMVDSSKPQRAALEKHPLFPAECLENVAKVDAERERAKAEEMALKEAEKERKESEKLAELKAKYDTDTLRSAAE